MARHLGCYFDSCGKDPMAKIVARDDCAGESTGIRYVQYRDMVKSLGWNYLNFLPTRSCKCSRNAAKDFYTNHHHQSGILDLTQRPRSQDELTRGMLGLKML